MARQKQQTKIAIRRQKVAVNLVGGLSLTQIAAAIGVSVVTISRDAKALIEQWRAESTELVDELVCIENARLDRMLNAVFADAVGRGDKGPSLLAIDRVLKIMERRARMLGLDAAKKCKMVGESDEDLLAWIEEHTEQLPTPIKSESNHNSFV